MHSMYFPLFKNKSILDSLFENKNILEMGNDMLNKIRVDGLIK